MTATVKLEIIGNPSPADRALALLVIQRLRQVIRAEYPGVTVIYPGEAGDEKSGVDEKSGDRFPPLYDLEKLRPFI